MKKHYVLGFMFSESRLMTALIMKETPAWQAGKFNGIGGKIETFDENIDAAMRREFREETGVDHEEWDYMMEMQGPHFIMHVFRAFTNKVNQVKTTTGEKIHLLSTDVVRAMLLKAPELFVANMQWVFPFMLDDGTQSSKAAGDGVAPLFARISY